MRLGTPGPHELQWKAKSFFPHYGRESRSILINSKELMLTPALAEDELQPLIHELGHALGFRHEQVRAEAPQECNWQGEPATALRPLTDYDSRSVMHYDCGQVPFRHLHVSLRDVQGARSVYGAPARSLVDPFSKPQSGTWVDVSGDGVADYCRLVGTLNGINGSLQCTLSANGGFGSTITSDPLDWGTRRRARGWTSTATGRRTSAVHSHGARRSRCGARCPRARASARH